MKFLKKMFLTLLTMIPSTLLLSACLNKQVNVDVFQDGLTEFNINQPGNNRNISVPINTENEVGAQYLHSHIVSLFLQDKKNQKNNVAATGFILNTFANQENNDNNEKNDKTNLSDESIKLLIGTNFHVVKNFFPKVNLVKINASTNNVSPKLSSQPENKNKNFNLGFFDFSYVNPSLNGFAKSDFNFYQLNEPNSNSNTNNQNQRNVYLPITSSNVELIYTATNLKINKNLFKFDQEINLFQKYRDEIIQQPRNEITWIDSYNPALKDSFSKTQENNINLYKTEFNFGVDFAVLQITIPKAQQPDWLKTFITKMQTNDTNYSAIQTTRNFVLDSNLQTPDFIIGGTSVLSDDQKYKELVNNANPEIKIKNNLNISEIFPSSINLKNWNNYFEVSNLYPALTFENVSKIIPNDDGGFISFNLDIINKNKEISKHKKTLTFNVSGFKSKTAKTIITPVKSKPYRDGEPVAKWIEAYVKKGTFSDKSIYNKANNLWNEKIYNNNEFYNNNESLVKTETNENIINYQNKNFLSIGSEILTNNLDLNPGSSGSLVIGNKWVPNDSPGTGYNLIGIYSGVKKYFNPVAKSFRNIGNFLLFSSPFRYELFQAKNKLSYPALCDVLNSKNITGKLANSDKTCPSVNEDNNN